MADPKALSPMGTPYLSPSQREAARDAGPITFAQAERIIELLVRIDQRLIGLRSGQIGQMMGVRP